MIIVIAPRYDEVTTKTHAIAESLLEEIAVLDVAFAHLLEEDVTVEKITEIMGDSIHAVAYYGHGDELGRLLTQDRTPWCELCVELLRGKVVYAHACRGLAYLSRFGPTLGLSCAIGYRIDLFQPSVADIAFWQRFREIHKFVARELAAGQVVHAVWGAFYDLCTLHLTQLHEEGAGVIELIAVMQARDEFDVVDF